MAVVVMGVMIVAGVAVLLVLIAGRVSAPEQAAAALLLDEPPGTMLAGVALSGDRLALQLHGGGPDRVAVFDLRRGGAPVRVGLSR